MNPEALLPPQNLTAEQSVLGSMLLHNEAFDEVAEILKDRHFYAEAHQTIFGAFAAMWDHGVRGIDSVTLAEELQRRDALDQVGGVRYLLEILESVPHAAHARYYARIVREAYDARSLINALTDGLRSVYERGPEDLIEGIAAEVEQRIHQTMEERQTNEPQRLSALMPELMASMASGRSIAEFIKTGFPAIDQTTGGIGPGKIVVLAARTSHGKTALVCSLALRLGERGNAVLVASYEQGWKELSARLLSIASQVDLTTVENGQGSSADLQAIAEAANHLGQLPILIDDQQRDETALAATIRLQARKNGVRVVVVDYLQLVEPRDRRVPREQQVAGVSRTLKRVALETGVCVVLLSQLNRGVENRDDKRPRLADLRESGAIEQDADQVWLLHRPGKDDPEKFDDHGELSIAKNRSGPTGRITLGWNARCAEYSE